ncbi:RluA family pseudouridine synthase [Synoicihabitans lomoniglobus]|uniref:RNA pseudouridine synthase n=1 Tax=Synoicihabitans lomoniglobus TaxID=2909285 RepID=A0AAF0I7J7_9BACT|nr:RNA pseudouridine synthase [Opitutaceae bacterium LMO-M01]WED66796.1 RNA pseudouridine synthase [Opitutaceae bacterium LMO-M01]
MNRSDAVPELDAPLGKGVEIVTADASGLYALAKPAGVLSHPNKSGEEPRSLLNTPYTLTGECYGWTSADGTERRAWLLNRLDSGTSGVVLLATDEALARHIRALFKTKRIQKTYAALVFGRPVTRREVWHDRLAVQKQGGRIRTGGQGNIPAESIMQWVDSARQATPPLSLIQLEPRTGRSHQLRVQAALRHLPIVGDATYGDFRLNRDFAKRSGDKRLFLHSFRTRFDYEWRGRRHRFQAEAPLPESFAQALQRG